MKKSERKVPDAQITLSDGSRQHLSDFWKTGKLVLVFLRHLG